MRLPWLAGCAIIAILPLLWLPALPGLGILAFAGVLALLLTRLRGTVIAVVAMTLLLMVWGVLSAYQALWPTQHYRRRPAGGSVPPRDGWPDSAPRTDCAPGGPLPVPPGWRDVIRGTCTSPRLCGAALDDDAASAAGAWAAQ